VGSWFFPSYVNPPSPPFSTSKFQMHDQQQISSHVPTHLAPPSGVPAAGGDTLSYSSPVPPPISIEPDAANRRATAAADALLSAVPMRTAGAEAAAAAAAASLGTTAAAAAAAAAAASAAR